MSEKETEGEEQEEEQQEDEEEHDDEDEEVTSTWNQQFWHPLSDLFSFNWPRIQVTSNVRDNLTKSQVANVLFILRVHCKALSPVTGSIPLSPLWRKRRRRGQMTLMGIVGRPSYPRPHYTASYWVGRFRDLG